MRSVFRSPWAHVAGCYYSFTLLGALWIAFGVGGAMYFAPVFLVFVVTPILDAVFGKNLLNYDEAQFTAVQTRVMGAAPYLFIVGYIVATASACAVYAQISLIEQIGLAMSVGGIGAVAIACGHELFHKSAPTAQIAGRIPLIFTGYPQFPQTHLRGHHVHACTTLDHSTALRGEGLYRYLVRTLVNNYHLAWSLGWSGRRYPVLESVASTTLCFLAGAILAVVSTVLWGLPALYLFVAQALVAIFISEVINYMGHYGLLYGSSPEGDRGKRTAPIAWNVYYPFSSYLTFITQRHADHHRFASRPYYLLRTDPGAPEMPYGYPLMILIAMIPALWRRTMDPRLSRHEAQMAR